MNDSTTDLETIAAEALAAVTPPLDEKARPGYCETAPGHTSRTLEFWRVNYSAWGAKGCASTPLPSENAVRGFLEFGAERKEMTDFTVTKYELVETGHDVTDQFITEK